MKETVRLNFDFPRKFYPELKKLCAEKGVSFRAYITKLLLRELEKEEDRILGAKAKKRLREIDKSENIAFEDAMESAGWDEEDI